MPREKSQPATSPAGGSSGSSTSASGAAAAAPSSSGSSILPLQCSRASGPRRAPISSGAAASSRAPAGSGADTSSRARAPRPQPAARGRRAACPRPDRPPARSDATGAAPGDAPVAGTNGAPPGDADPRGDAAGTDGQRPSRAAGLVPARDHALLAGAARVGQTRAVTVSGPARRSAAAASTRAYEPRRERLRRARAARSRSGGRDPRSSRRGRPGFGSACTTRARLARYGPAAALDTLNAMRSPGAAESRSV